MISEKEIYDYIAMQTGVSTKQLIHKFGLGKDAIRKRIKPYIERGEIHITKEPRNGKIVFVYHLPGRYRSKKDVKAVIQALISKPWNKSFTWSGA